MANIQKIWKDFSVYYLKMKSCLRDCCGLSWQAANYPTAICSLPSHIMGWGRELGERGKTHGFRERKFNKKEKGGREQK